jgi:hypothetical protein
MSEMFLPKNHALRANENLYRGALNRTDSAPATNGCLHWFNPLLSN